MPTAASPPVRDQALNDGNNFTHYAEQAVVLFPTAKQANVFFISSGLRWPACHQYTPHPIRNAVDRGADI